MNFNEVYDCLNLIFEMASQNRVKHYHFKIKQISKSVNCIKLHLIIILLYFILLFSVQITSERDTCCPTLLL